MNWVTGERRVNGNYLCELEAQPGGPEGRPDTTAGSKPINKPGLPRGVQPCFRGWGVGKSTSSLAR